MHSLEIRASLVPGTVDWHGGERMGQVHGKPCFISAAAASVSCPLFLAASFPSFGGSLHEPLGRSRYYPCWWSPRQFPFNMTHQVVFMYGFNSYKSWKMRPSMVLVPLRNFCKTSMEQVLQSFRETQLRVPVATDGDTNKASSNQVEASESHLDSGQVRRSLSQNMAKQILNFWVKPSN